MVEPLQVQFVDAAKSERCQSVLMKHVRAVRRDFFRHLEYVDVGFKARQARLSVRPDAAAAIQSDLGDLGVMERRPIVEDAR
jgi:hypothetical protein